MLLSYCTIGNDISNKIKDTGGGTKIDDEIAKDLKAEFPTMKGYSARNLR